MNKKDEDKKSAELQVLNAKLYQEEQEIYYAPVWLRRPKMLPLRGGRQATECVLKAPSG